MESLIMDWKDSSACFSHTGKPSRTMLLSASAFHGISPSNLRNTSLCEELPGSVLVAANAKDHNHVRYRSVLQQLQDLAGRGTTSVARWLHGRILWLTGLCVLDNLVDLGNNTSNRSQRRRLHIFPVPKDVTVIYV